MLFLLLIKMTMNVLKTNLNKFILDIPTLDVNSCLQCTLLLYVFHTSSFRCLGDLLSLLSLRFFGTCYPKHHL